jgi:uncharacterized membrane protein YesL
MRPNAFLIGGWVLIAIALLHITTPGFYAYHAAGCLAFLAYFALTPKKQDENKLTTDN